MTKYPEGRQAFVLTTHGETVPMLVVEHDARGVIGLVSVERLLVREQIKEIVWAGTPEFNELRAAKTQSNTAD